MAENHCIMSHLLFVCVSGSTARTNRSLPVLDLLGTSSICGSHQRHCVRKVAVLLILVPCAEHQLRGMDTPMCFSGTFQNETSYEKLVIAFILSESYANYKQC